MQAVVSLLPEPYHGQVLEIWDRLENRFGLNYIRVTPIPHFTWQLGEAYREEPVEAFLDELTRSLEPFKITTSGVNHFAGQNPTLFIEIAKSRKLMDLHEKLWGELSPHTLSPSPYYSVDYWQPHITLALEDLLWEDLDEVSDFVEQYPLEWKFTLDNLVILCQNPNGVAQVERVFTFGKGLTQSFDCSPFNP